MKKISCVAVDDEPLALSIMEKFCQRLPQLELRCFNSPRLALEYLKANPVQIVFLDINMPEMQGLEIAEALSPCSSIIFTTAYDQYALKSYEFNTVDYLLKPFNFARFEKAVQKALGLIQERKTEATLAVKVDYRTVLIPVDKILYIEVVGNYLKIYTEGQNYLPQMTMKEAQLLLDEKQFLRVHRSYLINLAKVDSYSRRELIVAGKLIPIGKSYKGLLDCLNKEPQRDTL